MIGNDVVDLRDPETRPSSTHPRFDARVFSEAERQAIATSDEPNRIRWRLWAAKEAAFKVARKLDPRTVFSPSRFEVAGSVVMHDGRAFSLAFADGDDFVHAIVRAHLGVASWSGVRSVSDASSSAVRNAAIAAAAAVLGAGDGEVSIVTRDRIPHLEIRGHRAPLDLSLSHHGHFIAWAFTVAADRRPLRSDARRTGGLHSSSPAGRG